MHGLVIQVRIILLDARFLAHHRCLTSCVLRKVRRRFIALPEQIPEAIAAAWAGTCELCLRLLAPVCADCGHEGFEAGSRCRHDGIGNFDLCPGREENAVEGRIGGKKGSEKVVDPQRAEYYSGQTDTESHDDYALLCQRHPQPSDEEDGHSKYGNLQDNVEGSYDLPPY